MVTFIKWLVPFLTTALTISIGFLITVEWVHSLSLGVAILYLIFIPLFLLGIGVGGGVALSVLVIPRILKEKPPPPKTLSPLICTQCKNVSTNLWPGAFCPNCGSSLEPQPNNVPPKKKSSNLIFSILAVILIFIVIVFYIGLTVQTGSESQPPLKTYEKYFDRGVSNNNSKQYIKAIEDFTKAIELNPYRADTYFNRGLVYQGLEQYIKAINEYTKAIRLNPYDTATYNNRGYSYYNLGQYEEALKNYAKAIKLEPTNQTAINNRKILLEEHPELKP